MVRRDGQLDWAQSERIMAILPHFYIRLGVISGKSGGSGIEGTGHMLVGMGCMGSSAAAISTFGEKCVLCITSQAFRKIQIEIRNFGKRMLNMKEKCHKARHIIKY